MAIHLAPREQWYLMLGIGDANGDREEMSFGSFFDEQDYFSAAEFGFTPELEGVGQGYYQFTVWHSDGPEQRPGQDRKDGDGFSVRFEQFFGDNLMPFLTYARASGKAVALRQLLTAGVGFANILGYQDDVIAIGWSWGQPDDRSLQNQQTTEVFYRLQISDQFQVTPNIQWIREPSRNRDDDDIGVIGLRLRFDF